jgi:(+)-pinoresinol hydroxylase
MKSLHRFLIIILLAAPLARNAVAEEAASAHGKQVFELWCSACHKRLNPGDLPVAGTSSLARKYGDTQPAALEQRTDLTPALLRTIVRHGIKSMPASRKTEISDADLEALVAYLTARNH